MMVLLHQTHQLSLDSWRLREKQPYGSGWDEDINLQTTDPGAQPGKGGGLAPGRG